MKEDKEIRQIINVFSDLQECFNCKGKDYTYIYECSKTFYHIINNLNEQLSRMLAIHFEEQLMKGNK